MWGGIRVAPNNQTKRLDMKLIKLLTIAAFVTTLLAGPAITTAAEKSDKTCCEKAKAADKDCSHPCCITAKKDGKTCEKCNPKKEEKKEEKK
jgi:hypothetical protein